MSQEVTSLLVIFVSSFYSKRCPYPQCTAVLFVCAAVTSKNPSCVSPPQRWKSEAPTNKTKNTPLFVFFFFQRVKTRREELLKAQSQSLFSLTQKHLKNEVHTMINTSTSKKRHKLQLFLYQNKSLKNHFRTEYKIENEFTPHSAYRCALVGGASCPYYNTQWWLAVALPVQTSTMKDGFMNLRSSAVHPQSNKI